MESPFTKTFGASDVVRGADITPSTLQNWLRRDVIVGHRKIQGGGSQGRHRRFTYFNVIEIATAAALTRCGVVDLALAFGAAGSFAHGGSGGSGWEGDRSTASPQRWPGLPFPGPCWTMLAVAGTKSWSFAWRPGTDPLAQVDHVLGRPEGYVLVNASELFRKVCLRLDLQPGQIMDRAYGSAEVGESMAQQPGENG
jgi:hypothetical protein